MYPVRADAAGRYYDSALRSVRLWRCLLSKQILSVGADRRVRPRVSILIGRMCLYINGCSLARWMYPVRADAAGRYETPVICMVRLG